MAINSNNPGFVKFSSWGRTRQPKNINGGHTAEVTINGSATVPATSSQGFNTENQRFLHLTYVENNVGTPKITVWGYSHAFGVWAPLTDIRGVPIEITAVQDAAKSQVFEIDGVDKVFFVSDQANPTEGDKLFAACSTF
jgi:hypothetical protein